MPEALEVRCPECGMTLFVDRRTGKVLETRKPVEGVGEGEDKFDALLRKAKGRGDAAMEKFRQAQEREKDKLSRLDSLFKETTERVKESGEDLRPGERDVDLD